MSARSDYQATKPTRADYDEWEVLFRAYIEFYNSSLPDEQYRKTFERIIDEENDLNALVLRHNVDGKDVLIGIAHFFPQQTAWREEKALHLNDLFVNPTYRGKGLGRLLIQKVADIAREMGCFRVQWVTKHDNVTARALYDTLASSEFVAYRMNLK